MTAAYDPTLWSTYLAAQLSAAAALTGLIFVAVSINLGKIVISRALVARCAKALGALMGVLAAASFALVPEQSRMSLGTELALSGLAVWAVVTWTHHIASHRNPYVSWVNRFVQTTLTQLASIPMVIAGISLALGRGGGLFWLVGGTLGSFVVALLDAWVLLIEIQR